MSEIKIKTNGREFTSWTNVVINRSLDSVCGTYEVSVIDTGELSLKRLNIKMGDVVEVLIDDNVIITGYIEDINPSYTKTEHKITIGGRAKTGDLVDCSFPSKLRDWKQQTILAIITSICNEFNIDVVVDVALQSAVAKKIDFTANEGETAFEAIRRLSINGAFRMVTSTKGELALVQSGNRKATTKLQKGINILEGNLIQSNKERYSDYKVKGAGSSGIFSSLVKTTTPSAEAVDSGITRSRPLTILTEINTEIGSAIDRANWERALRAGNSRLLNYMVQGWVQKDGTPWDINTLVDVEDDILSVNGRFLIQGVSFILDPRSGTTSNLTLCSPEKYKLEADIKAIETASDGSGSGFGLGGLL